MLGLPFFTLSLEVIALYSSSDSVESDLADVHTLQHFPGGCLDCNADHHRKYVFLCRSCPSLTSILTVIMVIRVYALYNRSRPILGFLLVIGLGVVGVSLVRVLSKLI
jgi:hypothetical protein